MRSRFFAALLGAVTVTACTETLPPAPFANDQEPSFAKAPSVPDPTATVKIPLDDAALSLKSDQAFSDGTYSVYANGVCGVSATIFLGGSGDMVLLGGNPRNADNGCTLYPRKYTVLYPDGGSDLVSGGTIAVTELQNGTFSIPVGTSALRGFHVQTASARCEGVHWGANAGGDKVIVTRTASDTWHVTTQPYPNDQAVCKNTVKRQIVGTPLGHMPMDLWIVSSRALP